MARNRKTSRAAIAGLAWAFAFQLALFAILRPIVNPDPGESQFYLLWVTAGGAAVSVLVAELRGGHSWWNILLPPIFFVATWAFLMVVNFLSCDDTIPNLFFNAQCD